MKTVITSGQLTKTIELMNQKGMTPERYNQLLESGILADVFDPGADLLGDRNGVRKSIGLDILYDLDIFRISVDYGKSLEQMVGKTNCRDLDHKPVGDIFPKHTRSDVAVFDICFLDTRRLWGYLSHESKSSYYDNHDTPTIKKIEDDIRQKNKWGKKEDPSKNPWVLGKIEHLLIFGNDFPELHFHHNVIALGTIIDINNCSGYYDGKYAPYLDHYSGKRLLRYGLLERDHNKFSRNCKFCGEFVILLVREVHKKV